MISAILFAGVIATVNGLFLYRRLKSEAGFFMLCLVFLCFILVHFLHVLLCHTFLNTPEQRYIDWAAPYGMLYGPFLYFGAQDKTITRKDIPAISVHAIPLAVFFLLYVFILGTEGKNTSLLAFHRFWLYTCMAVSFSIYSALVVLSKRKLRRLLVSFGMILFFVAVLFVSSRMNSANEPVKNYEWSRAVIYSLMLGVVVVLNVQGITALSSKASRARKSRNTVPGNGSGPSYLKSSLSEEMLSTYYTRLSNAMEKEMVFLDQDLSLEKLSGRLRIPRHHLTQLLSTYIDTTFYQYVNSYRVNYACMLIKTSQPGKPLEEIGFMSGFNSKASFNKYFRNQIGCTPSEYRRENIS